MKPPGAPRRRAHLPLLAAAAATLSFASIAAIGGTAGAFGHHGPHGASSFLGSLQGPAANVGSTVPSNGDLNPYGIVNVSKSEGKLVRGDTLVSNFNASSNVQGTGTTVVELAPNGSLTLFAQLDPNLATCPGGVGLTTALAILPRGYVVVGSLPTESGGPLAGCLIVLDRNGNVVTTWSGGDINGPWDMTSVSHGNFSELFVTNVLNGTVAAGGTEVDQGTVVRLDVVTRPHRTPVVVSNTVIGDGFAEQLNGPALVLGPTGVALGKHDTLYVVDNINNRIASIPDASDRHSTFSVAGGTTVFAGAPLNAPLGLTLAPNGNVVAANGGDGNAVEVTPSGQVADSIQLDPLNAGGDLFGLVVSPSNKGILFVDDGDNTVKLFGH
jgi:hypothetical protein